MEETEEIGLTEEGDELRALKPIDKKITNTKLASLRAPSFEGYFASGSRSFAFNKEGEKLNSTIENKIGEIEDHLEHIIHLLREIDILRMVVRVESRYPQKKRFLTVIESDAYHSIIVGIDWDNQGSPTIGLVLPITNATETRLDGDGGLHISKSLTQPYMFKPVSVQTLWSAKQIIDKAVDYATKNNYFQGMATNGFVEYYEDRVLSDTRCMVEWNEMGDIYTNVSYDTINPDEDSEVEAMKDVIRNLLREVMRKVDLDEVTCNQVFQMCQENLGMDLKTHKKFINEEMLVVMGQMDSASKILDYLFLGSEWNASSLHDLKELGIGYILNITKEVDNFFPKTFSYYNIRVYDEENTELLRHWDHTYRFIERACQSGSKVLVHCRYGISRSASTVIAYLMKKKGWGMIETLEYVKGIRSIVEPNQGFQKQLIIYEGILNSSRNRFSKLFDKPPSEKNGLQKSVQKRKQLSDLHDKHDKHDIEVPKNTIDDENEHSKELNNELCKDGIEILSAVDGEIAPPEKTESHVGRKRLLRAKTMTSGAVFEEEEEEETETEHLTSHKSVDRSQSVEMRDAAEDHLMQQVAKAREIKHQLIGSINELPTIAPHNGVLAEDTSIVDTIKPSGIRKVSQSKPVNINQIL